jgi:hypothetical protein
MYERRQLPATWWRRPAGFLGLLVAMLLLAGAGGVAIGRTFADTPSATSIRNDAALPVVSKGSLNAPHGPTGMQGSLPIGFTDDKAGALSCVAVAGEALIDYVQIRRTTPVHDWISTYTTGPLSAASLQKIYDWNPKLYQRPASYRPTELANRRHAASVSELVPVGYRVLSFAPDAAHVEVWFHGAGWSAGSAFPNTVVDRSADVGLVWKAGDWKIISYKNPQGQEWEGPGLDDPSAKDFVPWPGGQFTFVTG